MFNTLRYQENPMKTFLRVHHIPIKIANIKICQKCWHGCREMGTYSLLVRVKTGTTIMKISVEVL